MTVESGWPAVALGVVAGTGIGWFYFAVLWFAVRQLPERKSTARTMVVMALSYIGRLVVAVAAFYWLATVGIGALIGGVLGFTLVAIVQTARRAGSGA